MELGTGFGVEIKTKEWIVRGIPMSKPWYNGYNKIIVGGTSTMNMSVRKKISLEEFYKMRDETDDLLEYIDGIVMMSPSPSTNHQRVSGRLHIKLAHYFDAKNCEVFAAPYDIELYKNELEGTKIFIPDLSVICDKNGLKENRYVGVPSLIVEILSPSNQSHDLITKMDAYMKYGVKEYWIINPMINAAQIYALNDEGYYEQTDVLKEKGVIKSTIFDGLEIDLKEIFNY